jgi:hypothetical protein
LWLPAADLRRWHLSLVAPSTVGLDVGQIERFNQRWEGRAAIVAIEFGLLRPSEMRAAAARLPERVDAYFEVRSGEAPAALSAIRELGGFAKIRMGGLTTDSFPRPADVVAFVLACAASGVPFKATAGLHHALGGSYPLTCEQGCARAKMCGFLNLAVMAALVHSGAGPSDALAALEDLSIDGRLFAGGGLRWRSQRLDRQDVDAARLRLFRSFGSCAFAEPVADLARLGIIEPEPHSGASPAGGT